MQTFYKKPRRPHDVCPGLPTIDGKTYKTYDVAQIISSDLRFVGFAAFWPILSDWSVDDGRLNQWWETLDRDDRHPINGVVGTPPEPFRSPLVVGEWDFLLTPEPFFFNPDGCLDGDEVEGDIMFRAITMYGLVDRHTEIVKTKDLIDFPILRCGDIRDVNVRFGRADDFNIPGSLGDILDPEVAYYLQMKFCPWDLPRALSKYTQRHFYIKRGDGVTTVFPLPNPGRSFLSFLISPKDEILNWDKFFGTDSNGNGVIGDTTVEAEEWRAYSTFAERVLVDDELMVRGRDYTVVNIGDMEGDGEADTAIRFTNPPPSGARIKILYSVDPPLYGGAYEWITVGRQSDVVDSAAAAMVSEGILVRSAVLLEAPVVVLWSAFDIRDPSHPTVPHLFKQFNLGDPNITGYHYDHPADNRSALKDDWSTTVPIASSNIIGVGGPNVNLLTQYFNEFTPAIFRGTFFGANDLLLVSSWDAAGSLGERPPIRTVRGPNTIEGSYNIGVATNTNLGWAVVETYKDLNGTVGLLIWGATGNDTFWAATAFMNGLFGIDNEKPGIEILKQIREDVDNNGPDSDDPITEVQIDSLYNLVSLPGGELSVVMLIDYSNVSPSGDIHPRIIITEELGTISEEPQHPDP